MFEKEITLRNRIGLQARPASLFVAKADNYLSDIFIEYEKTIYNAKSIMSVMSMGAGRGAHFILRIEGEDEEESGRALTHFLEEEILSLPS